MLLQQSWGSLWLKTLCCHSYAEGGQCCPLCFETFAVFLAQSAGALKEESLCYFNFLFLFYFNAIKTLGSFPGMKIAFERSVTPALFSSPIPETPSVIVMGCWGPSISPWERGWGREWCKGMRAKATALLSDDKSLQTQQWLSVTPGACRIMRITIQLQWYV